MMKDNEKKLNELIKKVLEQMREREYGKKISDHYRSSFSLLKSISEDMEEDVLSQRLIEAFLDSPIDCGEKWVEKEHTHRRRCIKLLLSLAQDGSIDWGRQKAEGRKHIWNGQD